MSTESFIHREIAVDITTKGSESRFLSGPDKISFETAHAVSEILARAYIDAGPAPVYIHEYKGESINPLVIDHQTTQLIRRLDLPEDRIDRHNQDEWSDEKELEAVRRTQIVHLVKERLISALEEVSKLSSLESQRYRMFLGDLTEMLKPFGISVEEMWKNAPKFGDETEMPTEFELEVPKELLKIALSKDYEADGIQSFDRAVLVPNMDTTEFIADHLNGEGSWWDVRRFTGAEEHPNNLNQGMPGSLKILNRFEELDINSAIIAATHGRIEQERLRAEDRPAYTVRFLDSKTIGGERSETEVLLEEAVRRDLPVMDLQTFLTLCIHPDFRGMLNNTYRLALNHMLPSGEIADVGRGGDRIIFGSREYPGQKNCRVFIAG